MILNTIWPPPNVGVVDEKDVFGTFGQKDVESQDVEESYTEKLESDSKVEAGEA